MKRFIIVDKQYRIFQSANLSDYLMAEASAGNISIIDTYMGTGVDLGGGHSKLQDWSSEWES